MKWKWNNNDNNEKWKKIMKIIENSNENEEIMK